MRSDRQRQQGFDAYQRGDFAGARRLLTPLALSGDVRAGVYAAESAVRLGENGAARFVLGRLDPSTMNDEETAMAAVVLTKAGDLPGAESLLAAAASTHGDWVHVRVERIGICLMTGRSEEAESLVDELARRSIDADSVERLRADVLRASGRVDEALAVYQRCAARSPDDPLLAEIIAFLTTSAAVVTAQQSAQAHRAFGRLCAARAGTGYTHAAKDDPDRRLRVAFVSDNFAAHSVSHFLTAPLQHLDRASFEVVGVYTNTLSDQTTKRLSAMCHRFIHVPGISARELAARLHAEKTDIAIDLNGLTQGHRMGAFALRPAPLQVTWLGYANTTGLVQIDHRLVDAITDPPGTEAFATERLARIAPCFVCFSPLDPLQPRPREPGPTTFASLNHSVKVTDAAIGLWARVLQTLPGSRLLLKARGLRGQSAQNRMSERCARAGINPGRLTVLGDTPTVAEHLEVYRQIDVLLDTFPYNGTTTTCESLLMGVPVVTLLGEPGRHAGRVGASLLSAAGLPELVAHNPDDYVRIAAELGTDSNRLKNLRESLPERVRHSALCDASAFGARFGGALRRLWHERARGH